MKVIICGAGQVGYGIAERLAAEQNDVSVIDTSPELIRSVRDALDVRGFVGHGAHPDVLEAAGAPEPRAQPRGGAHPAGRPLVCWLAARDAAEAAAASVALARAGCTELRVVA